MSPYRRFGHLLAISTATTVAVASTGVAVAQENQTVSFSITNFTDLHGYLEPGEGDDKAGEPMGVANLAALMDHLGQDNDHQIRTTSGDNVGGSAPISAIQDDEPTIEATNAMGIDVSAVGNHEFDKGYDDVVNRIIPNSDYPILGANVEGADELAPSAVEEFDGVKVGFVGTVTDKTPNKVSPSAIEGLTFTDPVTAANAEAERLKTSGEADIVVVLQHEDIVSHSGFNEHVDAAFGGDSHVLHDPEDNRAQAYEYGKNLIEVEFTYDVTAGEITETEWGVYDYADVIELGLTPEPTVQAIVDEAAEQFEILGQEVVATIENDYFRGSNPNGAPGTNRGVESTLNNMLANSNRIAMNEFLGGGDQIDLGLMNAGGVRADLAAGDVTFEDVITVQPFGNNLAYATLSGQAILDALESQWKDPQESRPRLSLGVSDNVSYSYDPTAEQGERINTVYIDDEPLDPNADYTVATATFLFEGGDGHIKPEEVRDLTDVGFLDSQAFADYLALEGHPTYRSGQGEIGITGHEELVPGETATLELSSLNYSSEGEPQAQEVTVTLGDATATAEIDNTTTAEDAGYGENGRATVEIDVPADVQDGQELRITTDAGTEILVPVKVAGEPGTPGQSSAAGSANGLSAGSSQFLTIATVLAVLGGVAWFVWPVLSEIASRFGFSFPQQPALPMSS